MTTVSTELKPAEKKGGWFKKFPKETLASPGGIILLFVIVIAEVFDLLIPGGSLTLELIPEIFICFLMSIVGKVPFKSLIVPLLIERIPILSDILPTWFIKLIS